MNQSLIILVYCVFCFVVSAVAMRFLRAAWLYFLISATLPPIVVIAADALWHGSLDTWASVAFVVAWLIAFGCALAYFLIARLARKRNAEKTGPNEAVTH